MLKKFITLLLLVYSTAQAGSLEHSVLVYNLQDDRPIVEQNRYAIRPVASITKLMTAIVSIELYSGNDKIKTGKKSSSTVDQLLTNLLVRSDNHSAELLAKHHPQGRSKFIDAMNAKAQQMGLTYTRFEDPSGLDSANVSNATDLAKLVAVAGTYAAIKQASAIVENNTNKTILTEFKDIIVSKTGFTSKAGRCLALLVDKAGTQYAIIVLGEPTKQVRDTLVRNLLLSELNTNKY